MNESEFLLKVLNSEFNPFRGWIKVFLDQNGEVEKCKFYRKNVKNGGKSRFSKAYSSREKYSESESRAMVEVFPGHIFNGKKFIKPD